MMKIISLCIPTNGIKEWVFPSLDSIYNQQIDDSLYEVIVTDNGGDESFYYEMQAYAENHENLIYRRNDTIQFENQLEALKLAGGEYLKFVNHRSVFMDGRLEMMIEFIKDNIEEKPVIYFSNGAMGWGPKAEHYNTFDAFVGGLKRYASWTSGVGVWREDYLKLPGGFTFDEISPHSSVLFAEREKNNYIINDTYWMKEITNEHANKGKYDLYKAFGVEELSITLDLYKAGAISADTFKAVKKDYGIFLSELYYRFNIKKEPCSYYLDGFEDAMGIFYDRDTVIGGAEDIEKKFIKKEG